MPSFLRLTAAISEFIAGMATNLCPVFFPEKFDENDFESSDSAGPH
jgi:hypothetical protein